jgi:hypothetical protein
MVVALLLLVNLFVITMMLVTLHQSRRHAEDAAATTAQNLTLVMVRDMQGTLQRIDLALFALRQEMARQRAAGGIREKELNAYITLLFTRFPELNSIRAADAVGRIEYGIGVLPGSHFSVADRAYFQEARRDPRASLLISEPVVGRISGQWVVILARRLDQADGSFAGVAYVAITLAQLTRSMGLIDLGPHGTATLRGADLGVYAKYPSIETLGNLIGRREASPTFLTLFRQGRTAGVYTARGGLDGVERTFAFMKIEDHPLIIHIGLASEDYLAKWRSEAHRYWAFVGLFTLLTSGLAWLLYHAWRREKAQAAAEVNMLRGLLPICASCKKIRDDAGYWNHLETYVSAHSAAKFTHGVCPECAEKLYPEVHRHPGKGT